MNACFFAKHLPGSLFSEQPCELGTVTTPILQMRELRSRETVTYSGSHNLISLSLAPSLFPSLQTLTHELNI